MFPCTHTSKLKALFKGFPSWAMHANQVIESLPIIHDVLGLMTWHLCGGTHLWSQLLGDQSRRSRSFQRHSKFQTHLGCLYKAVGRKISSLAKFKCYFLFDYMCTGTGGTGEMAQQLRARTALVRVPCSVPSTQIRQLTTTSNSKAREFDTLFWLSWAFHSHTQVSCTFMCTQLTRKRI